MAYIVCTSNLDLVSFLVPALYSSLKLEMFSFTCQILCVALVNYMYIHVLIGFCCGKKNKLFTHKVI